VGTKGQGGRFSGLGDYERLLALNLLLKSPRGGGGWGGESHTYDEGWVPSKAVHSNCEQGRTKIWGGKEKKNVELSIEPRNGCEEQKDQ